MGLSAASKALLKKSGGFVAQALKNATRLPGMYLDRVESGMKKVDEARRETNRKIVERNGGKW